MSDDTPERDEDDGPDRHVPEEDSAEQAGETGRDAETGRDTVDRTTAEESADSDSGDTVAVAADVVDEAWRVAVETGTLTGRPDADLDGDASNREPRATPRISTDRLFELLASPGNRFVLTYLLRVDDRAEYAELVEYVIARTDPPEELTETTFRGRVAVRLVTQSLPALADAGLVEVDSARQVVAATAATDVAAPYLALALSDLFNPPSTE